MGSPAGTSRGFKSEEFKIIGNLIGDVLDGLAQNPEDNSPVEQEVKIKVKNLCEKFPIYSVSNLKGDLNNALSFLWSR